YIVICLGVAIMNVGLLARKIQWIIIIFFIIGVLFIILSTVVYFWIGMLSTRAIPIICTNCKKPTKILGRVDACMHCKQPLTLDKELEGKEFDEKYNKRSYRRKVKQQTTKNK